MASQQLQVTQQTQQTQETQPTQQSYLTRFDEEANFAQLVSLTNTDRVASVLLPRKHPGYVYRFGRHPSCDVCLPGNRFSNYHFSVWEETSKSLNAHYSQSNSDSSVVMLEDTSTNGTYHNRVRMPKMHATVLNAGDEIAAGLGVDSDEVRFLVFLASKKADDLYSGNAEAAPYFARYSIREQIGKGAFASVRLAVERTTGTRYAIKILNQRKLASAGSSAKATQLFKREIEILKGASHPNIIDYVDMWKDDYEIFLVLELMPGGDLMDYIMRRERLQEHESVRILSQLLDALSYCHLHNITHRDIKPENILLTKDDPPIAKLTDFGLAKAIGPETFLKTFCGTLTYAAPEVLSLRGRSSGAYSSAVDMWSIGCVMFIMVTGTMPFAASDQDDVVRLIQAGEYDEERLEEIELSGPGMDFIESLLLLNPQQRMTADRAKQHAWIRETVGIHNDQEREKLQQQQQQIDADIMDHDSQIPASEVEPEKPSPAAIQSRPTNSYGYREPLSAYDNVSGPVPNGQSRFSQASSQFVGSSDYGVSQHKGEENYPQPQDHKPLDSQATITVERMRQANADKADWRNGHPQSVSSSAL